MEYIHSSIYFLYHLIQFWVAVWLVSIPAITGQEAGTPRTSCQSITGKHSIVLNCWRKPLCGTKFSRIFSLPPSFADLFSSLPQGRILTYHTSYTIQKCNDGLCQGLFCVAGAGSPGSAAWRSLGNRVLMNGCSNCVLMLSSAGCWRCSMLYT